MSETIISIQHVSKVVQDVSGTLSILRDIDFTVKAGETVAILGASGSGKSTLLSLMAGLDTPTEGRVMLAGKSLFDMSEDERAAWRGQQLGFVFQNFQLMGHLTALENVMLPLELAGHRDASRLAKDILTQVGLSQRLTHFPKVLSGGEQQRVSIARALANKPPVILADEPTAPLDSERALAVVSILNDMARQAQTAIIVVTHDEKIIPTFKRIYHIRDGQTVEEQGEGRALD